MFYFVGWGEAPHGGGTPPNPPFLEKSKILCEAVGFVTIFCGISPSFVVN